MVCIKTALPGAATGEVESTVRVIAPLTLVPVTIDSDGTLLGDVGLLQPERTASAPPIHSAPHRLGTKVAARRHVVIDVYHVCPGTTPLS